jgi:hypothetical protein
MLFLVDNIHYLETNSSVHGINTRYKNQSQIPLVRTYGIQRDITHIVQSIISWFGRIMALLHTTVDTWSHKMVPCPFFSHPSKQQLQVYGVFRKKVTVVKGSFPQVTEIKNVTV